MVSKATLLHLRIPFSFYLLPFFIFAMSQAAPSDPYCLIISFVVIHFFFYPSSNGYNSYYDKDEESIGGLEKPPPVSKELLYVSLALEALGIMLALAVSWQFALMVLGISMVSRSYSHPAIRLKKFPVTGLLTVALFQGAYTYFMAYLGMTGKGFESLLSYKVLMAGGLCTLMLLGSYPMTQVYQHGEDGKRGDLTMSRLLGIEGTFVWTGAVFFIAVLGFATYFFLYHSWITIVIFQLCLLPVLVYFFRWFLSVRKDKSAANYRSTMTLNALSSICFIAFFLYLCLVK